MAVWPFMLSGAALVAVAGWLLRDGVALYVGAVCALGIIAMQLPLVEPWRWAYAFALWTVCAITVSTRDGGQIAGFILFAVPLGYALLFFGWGPRLFAFIVTEVPFVLALIAGGWGLPDGWRDYRMDHRRGGVAGAGSVVLLDVPDDGVPARSRLSGEARE